MDLVFSPAFTLLGSPVTWLELVAFVLAVWMVVCNIRVDPTGWPLAILSSLLYFALFWRHKLYGDASLQLVFVAVAAWGWRQWLRGSMHVQDHEEPLRVRALPARGRWTALLALLVGWPLIGLFLRRYTDTDVPWFDAFPTAGSLIGQWLLGRKYIENWPAWVAVNAVGVGLFAYKGLWLTAVLYGIFLAMSFVGWRQWSLVAKEKPPAAPPEPSGSAGKLRTAP